MSTTKRVMQRYHSIDYLAMKKFNLLPIEWMLCENISFLSAVSENGYTDVKRRELAEHFDYKEDSMKKIVRSLVNRKFLKTNKKHHLKIGVNWVQVMKKNGHPITEEGVFKSPKEEGDSNHPNGGIQITLGGVFKSPSLTIGEKEKERVREKKEIKEKNEEGKSEENNRLKDVELRRVIQEIKLGCKKPSVIIDFTINSNSVDKNLNYEIAYKKYLELGAKKVKAEYLSYQENQVKNKIKFIQPLHTWLGDYTEVETNSVKKKVYSTATKKADVENYDDY